MPKTASKIAFVGCGYTHATRALEKPEVDLAVEACLMAAEDAGLDPAEIDGINVQVHHYPPPQTEAIVKGIGMKEVCWQREGGLGILPAGIAAQAIDAGECKAVLVCKIMNTIAPVATPQIDPESGGVGGAGQFEVPYGLGYTMQRIGLRARRYMHRYGITEEQVGAVAVVEREHALLNPWAYQKTPMTMEDYLSSRWIAEPVRLFDCDIPVNGAFAFLMARDDIARTLRHPPVYLAAWAQSPERGQDHLLPEILEGMSPIANILYKDAGLGPEEMDLWFMYDGFSFFVLHWMENLGLVPRGEAGRYVEGGDRIRITGPHPLNTHGGQLSEGRLHGHGHILEAVQQLRGTAGVRQAKNANTAIISSVFPDTGAAGILVSA
jgi:acetyl-CoA acetyltransferase